MSPEQGTENGLAPTTCKENGFEFKGFQYYKKCRLFQVINKFIH